MLKMVDFSIPVFYSPHMQKQTQSFSPSASKPAAVVADWQKQFGPTIEIIDFNPLTTSQLKIAHAPTYIEGLFNGTVKNGFGHKDAQFSTTFLYTCASLLEASKKALLSGIAVSPTSGFHHAHYDFAQGFCTVNGLIVTTELLKRDGLIKKVGILDFDMHYGNGTQNIIDKLGLSNYIVHYTAGRKYDLYFPSLEFLKPLIKRVYNKLFTPKQGQSTPKPKLRQKLLARKGEKFLNEIPTILESMKDCDLIIYQAGADQHIDDPYGGLLTSEQMKKRDFLVFEYAKSKGIPLVWNLAGGYQRDSSGSIEPVLTCHRNTASAMLKVYAN